MLHSLLRCGLQVSWASKGVGFVTEQGMSWGCCTPRGVHLILHPGAATHVKHSCSLVEWPNCRLYNFYAKEYNCWCSNDDSAGNLYSSSYDNSRVGYSEC